MAAWSKISTSQLEYSRIDADFYHPQYLRELNTWHSISEKIKVTKLKSLICCPVRTGRTPRLRIIEQGEQISPFIKTDDVREGYINFENPSNLPCKVLRARDYIPGDSVVVTIIGATPEIVGRTAIVRRVDPECVTNQNIAVISTNGNCDPYYLTAFLQTSLGRDQLWRQARRTEQVNLNCREVERILIPLPSSDVQYEIGNMLRESFARKDQSQILFTQAQQLLETELELDRLNLQKPVGYTARFSDIVRNNRADADYYQVQFREIRDHIRSYPGGFHRLIDCAVPLKPNINPLSSPNEQFRYVELADINSALGVITKAETYIGKSLPSRARRRVSTGDVIASSVVGSVDKSALIEETYDNSLASTGFFHFRPIGVSPQYLLILLRSQLVTMQIEQEATGGILSAVPDSRLKYIIVPNIPKEIQNSIGNLIIEAHKAKREADEHLQQAKTRVEQMIEEAVQHETFA
jgi:restriction endonuclease S subunit